MDKPFSAPIVPGLRTLAADYDGYIVDVWGVLYDGGTAFAGAAECLHRLKAIGKRVVVLSNSPRRAKVVTDRLAEIGIGPSLYDHVLTSGEEVFQQLRGRDDPWYRDLGRRCWETGKGRFSDVLEGLDLHSVDSIDAAEFVFSAGTAGSGDEVSDYTDRLTQAAGRGLPMICANPDIVVMHGGNRVICAGALAAEYERLGGQVRYHGKPHGAIYRTVLALLGVADRRRILAVGDGMPTDIAGAQAVGIDALLVAGGIHAEELGIESGHAPRADRIEALCQRTGCRPRAAVARMVW